MKSWAKKTAAAAGGLVGATAVAVAVGTLLWNRATERTVERLLTPAPDAVPQVFSADELATLPASVARYFRFALTPGQPLIRSARTSQTGEFNAGNGWSPFTATHHVHVTPPGFVWDARIYMTPVLPVRIRDSYVAGHGAMQGKFAGVVPVVNAVNRPDIDSGALLRYLAEAVWYPTALLPSQGVRWSAIDEHTALATLTDGATTVSLQFSFGEQGEIVRSYAPARFRDVNGQGVPTPWGGTYQQYIRVAGMMVPQSGDVAWFLPEGRSPYWRGTLQTVYEFANGSRAPR
ncbi:DUF6920 family protein [Hymenobacter latericus]|uniref:DUF6920 family protein n=1 Tax=Hymenobacter sp. YIM 151858-1 TaxID=2987688 RepID=UPI0022271D06|nr:DUF6544 family protein [Hymenobacter sp. YIM 151858-1]UYZ58092.1 hypothetical protein OIS50_13610 [Hymenobacter sp. YIM 151858-1]